MSLPLPEVRVSPDGRALAWRWPDEPTTGWWHQDSEGAGHDVGYVMGPEVDTWPRLVPGGVPQDGPGEDADGHPT